MTKIVSRGFRYIRSYFPAWNATKEERTNFAKCSDYETELSVFNKDDIHSKENGSIELPELNEEDINRESNKDKITEWQAGWNITNAIQGMFIVSFPYAVLQGGYWALFSILFIAYVCCHTGKILVECLYEENKYGNRVRVRGSYVEIANHVMGPRFGGKIVNCAQLIELLMTCILYVLLCGDLLIAIFPNTPIDLSSWIMISTVFLLPCAFLQTLKSVSWLSFWCSMAHMVINIIIIVYCLTKSSTWKFDDVQLRINIWTFPISLGIVVFSYTSQIFVTTLEGNLVDPGRFDCMMHWTHIAAAIFKTLFAYIGFVTWGMDTLEVITNNLSIPAFKVIVNVFLVIKAILSYPLPYFAAADLLEATFFRGRPLTFFPVCTDNEHKFKVWAVGLRLGLVIFTMLLAIFIPHFSILMGLIGSFTGTMLSLIWPCYFHLHIKWKEMPWYVKCADIFIIILGFFVGGIGIYYSGRALVRALNGLPPDVYRTHIPLRNQH